jgi:seryl-tRNA synthetase
MEDDNIIRDPDEIYADQLLETEQSPYDTDDIIQQIINRSKAEFELEQNNAEQRMLEEIIITENEEIIRQRFKQFTNLKLQLNRMKIIDKQNTNAYEFLLNVIEMYQKRYINFYEVTLDEYNNFVSLLKGLRLPKEELDVLYDKLLRKIE